MRGPDLRKLVRSLRTKSYEKLSIRKHLAALAPRSTSQSGGVPPEEKSDRGEEPHREVERDKDAVPHTGGTPPR